MLISGRQRKFWQLNIWELFQKNWGDNFLGENVFGENFLGKNILGEIFWVKIFWVKFFWVQIVYGENFGATSVDMTEHL